VDFYKQLKEELNTYNTVPDPYWMAGGTNQEPMGSTDEWNRVQNNEEYLELGRDVPLRRHVSQAHNDGVAGL